MTDETKVARNPLAGEQWYDRNFPGLWVNVDRVEGGRVMVHDMDEDAHTYSLEEFHREFQEEVPRG